MVSVGVSMMNLNFFAQPRGLRRLVIAAALATVAPLAGATHVGEELTLDQQAVASSDQFLSALRQFESMPAAQREAAIQRLTQLAEQRRARMLALIERNPKLAALRVLPATVRNRLPVQVQALVERDVALTGVVRAHVADDFARGRSQTLLHVLDDAGQRLELRLAQATEREQLSWVGKRAVINAVQFDRQLLVLEKRGVQLAALGGTTVGGTATPTTSAAVQGPQTALVVMLNFNDQPIECSQADLQGRMFGGSGSTLDQGFRQGSNNLVSFSGQVIGPFTINYSKGGSCDYNGWATAANALAQAAGFNPQNYMRVSYTMPRNLNCGWLGLGALGGTQPTPSWVQQCTSTGTFSHEIGHNLNFHHAATPGSEYGDASDPMGAAKLVQANAPNRVMAGWLAGSQVQDVTVGGTYSITVLEATAPSGPQVLRLRKADTNEYYYLSMRQPVGVDTNLWTTYQNNVSVHQSTGVMPAYTILLSSLAGGQAWSDAANGITVTSLGVSGSTATVSVALGGSTCVRQAPSIAASPAGQTAASGSMLAYALTLTNNNAAACPSTSFNLAQALPSGFSGALASSTGSLASGASINVPWNVTSQTGMADASYTLNATAADAATGSSAAAHASYTVLAAPPPPPPPPPPADTTPPVVAITSPAANATLTSRVVSLAAQAGDNVAVASVGFYIDGNLVATSNAAPYSANWNTRKAARGTHSITVRATDTSGNASSQTISVTLN